MHIEIHENTHFFWPYKGGVNVWARINDWMIGWFDHPERIQITNIRLVEPRK